MNDAIDKLFQFFGNIIDKMEIKKEKTKDIAYVKQETKKAKKESDSSKITKNSTNKTVTKNNTVVKNNNIAK